MRLLDIATVLDESDVGRGIVEAAGGEGLLDSCWSQALARRR